MVKMLKVKLKKSELLANDPRSLFSQARSMINKEFDKCCKKREKQPAVALFNKLVMSRPTLVAELKDKGLIMQKNVKGKAKVTGDAAPEMLTMALLLPGVVLRG